MDDSPRRHNASDKHHTSARRLFMNREERSNGEKQSNEGQARRRLVLVADDEAVNSGMDDPKREANVIARLMGLDSPEHKSAQCSTASRKPVQNLEQQQQRMHTNQGEVRQLQELLKIKEPLLLRELLKESDDVPYREATPPKKATLMEKFAGFVKRRPATSVEQLKKKPELVLSPVKSKPKSPSGSNNKASPIRSPCKSKRGLTLEAAVKILDSEQPVCTSSQDKRQVKQQKQQEQSKQQPKQSRRRFSLSRSSSEPCLSSSTSGSSAALKSEFKGGLIAKLSENVGRELRHVFGGSSSKTASSSSTSSSLSSSSSAQPSLMKRKISNLVRSKSDLGLQKIEHKLDSIRKQHDKEQQDSFSGSAASWPSTSVPTEDDYLDERQSFSQRSVKLSTTTRESSMRSSSSSSNNNNGAGVGSGGAGILRLFGNRDRGKENRNANATRKSEPSSSLVKALLLRKKNGSGGSSSSGSTGSNSVPGTSTSRPTATATKILQDQRPKNNNRRFPESVGIVSSVSERLQYCDEFSDDTTEHSRSPASSASSTSTRLDGSSCDCRARSESGQPSPVSVLEAPFIDEIHTQLDSSSGEDSPDAKLRLRLRDEAAVMPSSSLPATASSDNIINAILDISRIRCIDLSSIGIVTTGSRSSSRQEQAAYILEVLSTSRFISDGSRNDWFKQGLPINSHVFTILEKKLLSSTQRPKCSLHSRKLLFDCVQEVVDSRFGFTKPGSLLAKRLSGLTKIRSEKDLAYRIHEQVGEWEAMFCWSTDELVEKDMSVGSGRWQDWNAEVEEIAIELERGLLKGLVDEVLGLTGFDYC